MREGIQRLTADELKVVAAGAPDILKELEERIAYHRHHQEGQLQELLSRITTN